MRRLHPTIFLLVVFALLAGSIQTSHAAIYRVGTGAGCTHATIQAAVGAAGAHLGDDEIRLLNQTYVNQAILIDHPFDDGSLLLRGGYASCQAEQPTAGQRSVIDGGTNAQAMNIVGTRNVALYNLDIRDAVSPFAGGGIRLVGTRNITLVLVDTLVRGNRSPSGGGISVENTNAAGALGEVQLLLFGNSSVTSNYAQLGGGITCKRATIQLFDRSTIGLNVATSGGGGIHAENCRILSRSTGISGAVLWANQGGQGGGLYLDGAQAQADFFSADAAVPARIVGNSALFGGAISVVGDATVRLFDAIVEDNLASVRGGAVYIYSGDQTGANTRFLMFGGIEGAPGGAVPCADSEACNHLRNNRAFDESTGTFMAGGAVQIDADRPFGAQALFRGTRIEGNRGKTLMTHAYLFGQIWLDGALVVDNEVQGWLFDAAEEGNSLLITSSTIAENKVGSGFAVIHGPGGCDVKDDFRGNHAYRSIIWETGRTLIDATGPLLSSCFRYLVGNDFSGLPIAADRVVGNPLFVDPQLGDFHLSSFSPALDFAPAQPGDATRDREARVVDLPQPDDFGPQDLGAYEAATSDRIFRSNFEPLEER